MDSKHKMLIFNVILLLCTCFIKEILSKCPDDASNYIFIDEANYDRNFSPITEANKNPLGYVKGTIYYNQETPNPCIRVNGASQRRIEIMAEAIPAATICVSQNGNQPQCSSQGRLFLCVAGINSNYFEFTSTSDFESDVQFWYRFTLGPTAADDKEDGWCSSRHTDEYPTSLRTLPPNFPQNAEQIKTTGGSISLYFRFYLFIVMITVVQLIK